jgi:hypothetical protein
MDKWRVTLGLDRPLLWGGLCLILMSLVMGSACSQEEDVSSQPSASSKGRDVKRETNSASRAAPIKPGALTESSQKQLGLDSSTDLGHGGAIWYLETEEQSAHCARSMACKQSGLCAQVSLKRRGSLKPLDIKCIALSRQLCLDSTECQHRGHCTPLQGRCVAQSDLDCFQSQRCKSYGLCNIKGDRCVAKSDQDCKRSVACTDFQACSHRAGLCVNQADLVKECAYGCVKVEIGCFCHPDPPSVSPRSGYEPACLTQCQKSGGCVLSERGCTPRDRADCESSELCKTAGLCEFNKGRCIGTDRGCATSLQCSLAGLCSLHAGRCVATLEDDCLSSRGCAEQEMCQFKSDLPLSGERAHSKPSPVDQGVNSEVRSGYCVRAKQPTDCQDKCRRLGQCEEFDGACLAISTARCRASEVCKKYGHCTPKNGRCIAKWASDCQRSLNCKQIGRCTAKNGRCMK